MSIGINTKMIKLPDLIESSTWTDQTFQHWIRRWVQSEVSKLN